MRWPVIFSIASDTDATSTWRYPSSKAAPPAGSACFENARGRRSRAPPKEIDRQRMTAVKKSLIGLKIPASADFFIALPWLDKNLTAAGVPRKKKIVRSPVIQV